MGPVHVAETREQARANVRFGLQFWLNYFTKVGTLQLGMSGDGNIDTEIDALLEAKIAVIGTPTDLIAQMERLQEQAGGFGCFLDMAHYWANFEETKKSYELIARYVMPRFQGHIKARNDALDWAKSKHAGFSQLRRDAAAPNPRRHPAPVAGFAALVPGVARSAARAQSPVHRPQRWRRQSAGSSVAAPR